MCLNQYIIDAHERLKGFFDSCRDVAEPEDEFSVDQFSEATLIAKPVIYVTLAEIVDTHQLLIDHRFQVAPGQFSRPPCTTIPSSAGCLRKKIPDIFLAFAAAINLFENEYKVGVGGEGGQNNIGTRRVITLYIFVFVHTANFHTPDLKHSMA